METDENSCIRMLLSAPGMLHSVNFMNINEGVVRGVNFMNINEGIVR